MKYQYRIYHDEKCKHQQEKYPYRLDEKRLLNEYENLPTALRLGLAGARIEVSCDSEASEANGIKVTLVTDIPEHEVESSLNKLIAKRNAEAREQGICLVIDRLKLA